MIEKLRKIIERWLRFLFEFYLIDASKADKTNMMYILFFSIISIYFSNHHKGPDDFPPGGFPEYFTEVKAPFSPLAPVICSLFWVICYPVAAAEDPAANPPPIPGPAPIPIL